jgi:hypothetical protein
MAWGALGRPSGVGTGVARITALGLAGVGDGAVVDGEQEPIRRARAKRRARYLKFT